MKFRLSLIIGFFLLEALAFQQEVFGQSENVFLHPKKFYKKFLPNLRIQPKPTDTLYIKSYPNYLSVSAHVLSPSIRVDIISDKGGGSGVSRFRSNISDIIGFSGTYKLVTAGFAFALKSGIRTNQDFAKSGYRTATINYGSGAVMLQFKYVRFRGLTDVNLFNNYSVTDRYLQRSDIVGKEFHFEGLYNFAWKKYSYIAPFTFAQQQMKSQVGFLFKPGVYYNDLAGDAALIAKSQQVYFEDFSTVKEIRTLSIKLAPGVGGNFIFCKRFYLSTVFFPSYDLYFYKYLQQPNEKVKGKQTFVLVMDGKASVGYQSRRLFAGLRYEIENRNAALYKLRTNYVCNYIGMELGYRFNAPKIVKKVYKETMPPEK